MRVVTSDKAYRQEMNFCFKQKSVLEMDSLTELPSKELQVGTNIFLNQGYSTQDYYTGSRASVFVNREYFRFRFEGSLGVHNLKNETAKTARDIVMGDLKTTFNPEGVVEGSLEASHDYVYMDLYQPGGAREFITASSITPTIIVRPWERTKFQAWNSWKYLSDYNMQTQGEVSALYAVALAPTSVWLGIGADQIRFQRGTGNYWSPDRVSGISGKLETDIAFARNWTSVVNCSFGRGYDNGPKEWGWGYYFSGLIRYKPKDNLQVEFYMNRLETGLETDRWYLSQFGLNASTPF